MPPGGQISLAVDKMHRVVPRSTQRAQARTALRPTRPHANRDGFTDPVCRPLICYSSPHQRISPRFPTGARRQPMPDDVSRASFPNPVRTHRRWAHVAPQGQTATSRSAMGAAFGSQLPRSLRRLPKASARRDDVLIVLSRSACGATAYGLGHNRGTSVVAITVHPTKNCGPVLNPSNESPQSSGKVPMPTDQNGDNLALGPIPHLPIDRRRLGTAGARDSSLGDCLGFSAASAVVVVRCSWHVGMRADSSERGVSGACGTSGLFWVDTPRLADRCPDDWRHGFSRLWEAGLWPARGISPERSMNADG